MSMKRSTIGRAVTGTLLAVALGAGSASAEEVVRTLYAGQTLPVGTVTITTGTPGQVDFVLDQSNNFCLTEIHVAVGELGTGIPVNKQGSPQIGRFPYQDHPVCEKSSGFQISDGIAEGDNVAAHAKVQYADASMTESAWAAGYRFTPSKDWSTYVTIAPPLPEKHVFARAYIERDGLPGYTLDSLNDPDALIAELVDDNNSGFIDIGDKVYTSQYPTEFTAAIRGDFGVNEHTVTAVQAVFNGASGQIIQVAVAGGTIVFGYAANPDGSSIESYSESATGGIGNETLRIADGNGGQQVDTLKALEGDGPSQPEVNVPLATRPGGGDDMFIEIEFSLP